MKKVCLVTAGHLATCPRVVKAADALSECGLKVRVVSCRYEPWAMVADRSVYRGRGWTWRCVDYSASQAPMTYLVSGLRRKVGRALTTVAHPERCSVRWAARARGRVHDELVRAVLEEPADLIYGFTVGGLSVAEEASRRAGVPFALDLEDYYQGQLDRPADWLDLALMERLEAVAIPRARFVTAGSTAIGRAYARRTGVVVVPIQNTFPLPSPPDLERPRGGPLSLYWFSQTIGPGRGIEDVIEALRRNGVTCELHLRGKPQPAFVEHLSALAGQVGVRIEIHPPAPPEHMVELCRPHDVGLACEPGGDRNNKLLLSNKALTYVLAGLAVVLTDTEGQRDFGLSLGAGALLHRHGDVEALGKGLRAWQLDPDLLLISKRASWSAAAARWHWEHDDDRGRLVRLVEQAIK